jgi:hypothetical protein
METLNKSPRYADMRVAVQENWTRNCIEIFFLVTYPDGKQYVIDDITLKEQSSDNMEYSSGVRLSNDTARQLMDKLWLQGLRPSNDIASTGQLGAMQAHIDSLKASIVRLETIITKLIPQYRK